MNKTAAESERLREWAREATQEEIEERRLEIVRDIQDIEAQLSDRNRQTDGGRMNGDDYHAWRRTAVHARSVRLIELRILNAERSTRQKAAGAEGWHDRTSQLGRLETKLDYIIELLEEEE